MLKKIYLVLIEPRSNQPDERNRELVLNYLLLGFTSVIAAEILISLFGFLVLQQHYIGYRILSMYLVLVVFLGLYWFARKRQQRVVAFVVISILLGLTTLVVSEWGTVTPTGTLLFGLVIVMSGILLGSRHALYAALASVLILSLFEYLKNAGLVIPNLSWTKRPSSMSDIVGFGIIFAIIALILWLYNQQMERSLERAHKSEAALNKQNESLEQTVNERTRELEVAQMEKLQQVYRFAELGRISSALFHDLANHLTSVSLDIEGLSTNRQSDLMQQVQDNIGYIDSIVQRVRLQLRGQGTIERFKVISEINTVIKALNYKLVQAHMQLEFQKPPKALYCRGDVIPFRQIISNLLGNAIEAYTGMGASKPRIVINVLKDGSNIVITVQDWGKGITSAKQAKVFEPFYSSKIDGTGIGLFIVKQIVEHDLKGSIKMVSSPKTGTLFTVTIPGTP